MTKAKWRNDRWLMQRLQQAHFPESDALTLCNWVRAADSVKPVLFVGAGWSRNALGPPHRKALTWPELVLPRTLVDGRSRQQDDGHCGA